MTIIAVDTYRLSNLVKRELWPEAGYCRLQVEAGEAGDYKIGTVLGKVTATGKYIVSKVGALDGSDVAVAVVMEDKTVTDGSKVLVLVRGPSAVSREALIFDDTYTGDTEKQVAYAQLEDLGIMTNVTV